MLEFKKKINAGNSKNYRQKSTKKEILFHNLYKMHKHKKRWQITRQFLHFTFLNFKFCFKCFFLSRLCLTNVFLVETVQPKYTFKVI